MKKLLLSILLLSSPLSYAIKLPDAKSLEDGLIAEGFSDIVCNTHIINRLAEQDLDADEIFGLVASELAFAPHLTDPIEANRIHSRKDEIFQIILKDDSETLKEVREIAASKETNLPANDSLSYAGFIKLPDAETLRERFKNANLVHFVDNTDIVKQLADQQLDPFSVYVVVQSTLSSYIIGMENSQQAFLIRSRKDHIYEIVLRDHPEALKTIRELGF